MVKKLFKHEFSAWMRIMGIIYIVMVSFSAAFRLFLCLESDSVAFEVISVLGAVIFILFLTVCISFCPIFGIVRFYKNLFTGEGYLTLTLPVTAAQHIWVKALTSAAMLLLTLLVTALSVTIVMLGDVLTEAVKAADYMLKQIPAQYSGHIVGYCVEFLIFLVAGSIFGPMLYYACICIGQLFRKHRVLGAIGVYFGYYYLCQILVSVAIGAMAIAGAATPGDVIVDSMPTTAETLGAYHGLLCTVILWTVGIGMIYYVICHYILSKKLNLE